MKSWLQDNDIEMHSTNNEGKSIAAERFIRTFKNKIYKYMTQYQVSHIPCLLYYFPIIGTPVYRLLLCKSIDWFLYDRGTRHEKVYVITTLNITYHNICL